MTQIKFTHNLIGHFLDETHLNQGEEGVIVTQFSNFLENEFILNLNLLKKHLSIDLYEIKLNYNHFENSSQEFANFSAPNSTEHKWNFTLFTPIFHLYLKNEKTEIQRIIFHEIIHALDLKHLNENNQVFEKSKFETFSLSPDKHKKNHFSIQWLFLSHLSILRNEGIALFISHLFYPNYRNKKVSQDELEVFQSDLEKTLHCIHGFAYYKRISNKEALTILKQIKINAYSYADKILFRILQNNFSFCKVNSFDSIPFKTNDEEKTQIIYFLFEMDLSEWLKDIFKLDLKNSSLLDPHLVHNHCYILSNQNKKFKGNNILKAAYQTKTNDFIHFIQQVVSAKNNFEESIQAIKNIQNTKTVFDIQEENIQLAMHLIKHRSKYNHEIVDWTLTYFLTEMDFIPDNNLFLGYQDDWMILEGGVMLV